MRHRRKQGARGFKQLCHGLVAKAEREEWEFTHSPAAAQALSRCPGYKTDNVLGPTELVQSSSGDADSKPPNEETRKQTTIRAMQHKSNRKRKENWMGISRRPQKEKCPG